MLMTLDQWLARFFGAGRRADRASPVAQRASFGLDGVEMHQVEGDEFAPYWDGRGGDEGRGYGGQGDGDDNTPYRPYVRRPRAVQIEETDDQLFAFPAPAADFSPMTPPPAAATPSPIPPTELQPTGPDENERRARKEAEVARKSRAILAAAISPSDAPPPPSAPFFDPDRARVRFTRTPETSIARKQAEEEARRRAMEEAELARIEAERRVADEAARRAEEARQARADSFSPIAGGKPRVRFTRTPDRPLEPAPAPVRKTPAPEAAPAPAPLTAASPAPLAAPAPAPLSAPQPIASFSAMGARFSFSVGFGGMSSAPARPAPQSQPLPVSAPAAPKTEVEAPRPSTPIAQKPAWSRSARDEAPEPSIDLDDDPDFFAPEIQIEPEILAPTPIEVEKPQKMRLRLRAVAEPAAEAPQNIAEAPKLAFAPDLIATAIATPLPISSAAPEAPAAEARPVESSRVMRRTAKTPVGGFLEKIDAFDGDYEPFHADMLALPPYQLDEAAPDDELEVNADALEKTLEDFGVRGDVLNAHPGPVVTLYEFEPAPGIKSSRVIGLADDIARSMSAISARVAVVPGRNAIGIELPNPRRETVYLRELLASPEFVETRHKLAIALGKTIGGEPVIVDLAKMPHLLVAGTTGSGKSVAINTMILSLLYKHKPQDCRLIMVDPKMLELSVYDGIPHLLTPVVTDPKKAVVALKWAVREMEDRYKKMSKLGVRNIDGFNARAIEAREKGETVSRNVQTGFDRETGEAVYEQEQMDLTTLPYIVVIVDEMADLMMVAGKEIEGAIQRLAQMARAAGIHLIMATQRPSVDVITGTIKANFPTRISFQVTSKIDSRTILGEMGAEQLLGQGDMLYMAGGGRISRVHGPFVSDAEVEKVVAHLKMQGQPEYLDAVTVEEDGEDETEAAASSGDDEGADLYDRAVAIVLRDKKCSTSYVQRRLSIGYNKAASLVERMEKDGVVGPANHAGKRAILGGVDRAAFDGE